MDIKLKYILFAITLSLPVVAYLESMFFYGTAIRDFWYYITVGGAELLTAWIGYRMGWVDGIYEDDIE
jgi:hypothetical protein